MSSSSATPTDELPAVDDHLVEPDTPYEMYDGELVYVPPALEPHGPLQSQIAALVEAHTAPDFMVACELLTRVSRTSDVAPDVSVYPRARHPKTGGRQLEHLAFEIASTQPLSHVARKAALLANRGVRRVFVINVERERALEWSPSLGAWSLLDSSGHIEDLALAAALPVETLLRVARSDDAVARALLIKRNPVLEAALEQRTVEALEQGKQLGLERGKQLGLLEAARAKAEALFVVLAARRIRLESADRARILGERDPDQLDRWIARAATCTDIAAVLAAR